MEHTPGPWNVEGKEIWRRGTGYGAAEFAHVWVADVPNPNNRSLIAAAPELLEACEKAERFISNVMSFCGEGLEVVNWHQNGDTEPLDNIFEANMDGDELESLRKVIAKAKEQK